MKRKLSLLILFLIGTIICSSSLYAQRNQKSNKSTSTQTEKTQQPSSPTRQNPDRPPLPDFMTEDGKIDLSKLPENFSAELREEWTNADKDGDGFLNEEERQVAFGNRGGFPGGPMGQGEPNKNGIMELLREVFNDDNQFDIAKFLETFNEKLTEADADNNGSLDAKERLTITGNQGERRPGQNNPMRFGGFGQGQMPRPDFMTEDGKIDLSKLSDEMPEQMAESMKSADKDGDGFLDQEEQAAQREQMASQRPRFSGQPGQDGPMRFGGFGQGQMPRPDFMTEDGKIDLSKLSDEMPEQMAELMKSADKDGDGFLDQEEQAAQREQMMSQRPRFSGQPGQDGQRARDDRQSSNRRRDSARQNSSDRNNNREGRMTPPDQDRNRPEGMPEMGRGMNEMVIVRLVSTKIQEMTKNKKTVKISEIKTKLEQSLKEADADEDQFLNKEELQKLNETLPRMMGPMGPPEEGIEPNRQTPRQRERNNRSL